MRKANFSFKLNKDNSVVMWANEIGQFVYDLINQTTLYNKLNLVRISGSGVALNKDLNKIIVGDLEKNITIINKINKKIEELDENESETQESEDLLEKFKAIKVVELENELIHIKNSANNSFRCMFWDDELNSVYAGTLGGELYELNMTTYTLTLLTCLDSTITSIKIIRMNNYPLPLMLVSLTSGHLNIYEVLSNNLIELVNSFLCHKPQPENEDMKFGSLCMHAEIWGVCANPKSKLNQGTKLHIATCSEDQCTSIWAYDINNLSNEPDLIKTMKNHDLAVTAVDWKTLNNGENEILASCSDDRKVNIYNPLNNFELIYTFSSSEVVHDWHTITYLAIEEVKIIFNH